MKLKQALLSIFFMILFWSCGPSQREMAVEKINVAKNMVIHGDTIGAITLLDSVKILFPKAEVQVEVAKKIVNEYYQQLIDSRKMHLIRNDSVLLSLESKFNKEKTEFDRYTQYTHKRQTFNRSWDRSFLQVHLDERGELYLSSNYMGKEWLKHTGIRVYDGELQAKSDRVPLEDPLNHQSDFMDHKWEKISYMNGKADSVIHFIAENPELKIKCVFLGSRYYYILLEQPDIQAVVDALALSEAIKLRAKLENEIRVFESKVR